MSIGLTSHRPPVPASTAGRLIVACQDELAPLVDRFRGLQDDDGSVSGDLDVAGDLLRDIAATARRVLAGLGQEAFFEVFAADLTDWRAAGLDTSPHFDRTRDAYQPPGNHGLTFFCAPVLTTNGPDPVGRRLEFFLALREEPAECEHTAARRPHPKNKCQSARLLAASAGFRTGNCIVFFPENVAAAGKVEQQNYAVFFFNKFQRIYLAETVPAARRLLDGPGTGRSEGWRSTGMSPAHCYRARSVWGYLHDYFHHQGPRPFDEHMQVKLNWFVGLLEEIKVDAQTAIACHREEIPFGAEQVEFVLLERMFRYPRHPAAVRNFDAGTGVLLFSRLRAAGAITDVAGRMHLDWEHTVDALADLVSDIEAIEVACQDDTTYRAAAKAFVRRYLPEGEPGDRYRFTADQAVLAGAREPAPPLDFATLPY